MFALPDFQFQRLPEPPAMVRVESRSDVTWNRPVFKAPPLDITPVKLDPRTMADAIRRGIQHVR